MSTLQMPRSARIATVLISAAMALFAFSPAAGAQNDYTSVVTVQISTNPTPGGVVTVSGEASVGSVIVVTIDDVQIARYVVTAAGLVRTKAQTDTTIPFSFDVTIPTDISVGTHTLGVSIDGVMVSTTQFTIAAAGATGGQTNQNSLADTGVESGSLALASLGMLAVGSSLLIVRRRSVAAE